MEVSETAKAIITLLNNADDLILISNKRAEAKDVVRASVVYAKNNDFPLPDERIHSFYDVLLDSPPRVLSSLLREISFDVIDNDKKIAKAQKAKQILKS